MSKNEILTYRDVSSSTKTIPEGTRRGEFLKTLSMLVAGTLTGLFTEGLVHWFRLSMPVTFAVSFFSCWTLASLIYRPKKITHRAYILGLAGIALASYFVMRILGW